MSGGAFNPSMNPQQPGDPNYLGQSRGVDRPRPNMSYQTLFEGLGDIIGSGVQLIDENNKQNIQQRLLEGTDEINRDFGVDAATDATDQGETLFSAGQPNIPSGAAGIEREVGRLTSAFQDGRISDTYYWSRVNSLTRQVRSQYPGYRQEIDNAIAGIVGTNPANALRRSIQAEFEQSVKQASTEEDRYTRFAEQNPEHVPADFWQRYEQGNPYSFSEVREHVRQSQYSDASVRRDNARYDNLAKANNFESGEAKRIATRQAWEFVNRKALAPAIQAIGEETLDRLREGQPLSAQDRNEIEAAFAQLKTTARAGINELLNQPFVDDGEHSFASIITDQSDRNDIVQNAMVQIEQMEQNIFDGNFGLATMTARMAQATQDHDVAKALNEHDVARRMSLLNTLAPNIANAYFINNAHDVSAYVDAINSITFSETISGDAPEIGVQLDRMRDPGTGRIPAAGVRNWLDQKTWLLSNENSDTSSRLAAVRDIFREDTSWLEVRFSPEDRRQVVMQLTSPEITDAMLELRETEPEVWDRYRQFSYDAMNAVMKGEASNLEDGVRYNSRRLDIEFNPETNSFSVDLNEEEVARRMEMFEQQATMGAGASESARRLASAADDPEKLKKLILETEFPHLVKSIEAINQSLINLAPIYTADGREITDTFVDIITDFNATNPNESSLQEMMFRALRSNRGEQEDDSPRPFDDELPEDMRGEMLFNETDTRIAQYLNQTLPDLVASGQITQEEADRTAEGVRRVAQENAERLPTRGEVSTTQGVADNNYVPYTEDPPEANYVSLNVDQIDAGAGTVGMLELIGRAEAPAGYNQIYGHNRSAPITQMSINQVLEMQNEMVRRGSPSSASGRYQFIRSTLRGLRDELGLSGTEKMTPELQDRLAIALMERRGLRSYLDGRMSETRFINNLAKEWAGLPNTRGRSHYAGDGLNKATVSLSDVRRFVRKLKNSP